MVKLCEHKVIEECLVTVTRPEFIEGNEMPWIVTLGYIERCSDCKKELGEGWGDPYEFQTREEAEKFGSEKHKEMCIWKL